MLAIIDYKAGNQTSVFRALKGLGIPGVVTADPAVLRDAEGVIFPGVGAAAQAMGILRETGLDTVLKELVATGKPVFGVCLGCQILLEKSEESDTTTLGILQGSCKRFDESLVDEEGHPIIIPHMGWNGLNKVKENRILDGIPEGAEVYFVHSYYTEPAPELVIATTSHGIEFCSIYGRDGLWAAQFHPEKSGPWGLKILRNFYDYCQDAR